MKRYSMKFFEGHKSRASVVVPVECESGEWVKVEDAAALEARLKEAEAVFRSIESFPHYAYGDNEAACSMVAIAAAWLNKEAQA